MAAGDDNPELHVPNIDDLIASTLEERALASHRQLPRKKQHASCP